MEINKMEKKNQQTAITARIQYELTEAGQKASIISGGNGKSEQIAEGAIEAADVELFSVLSNGKLLLCLTGQQSEPHDVPELVKIRRAQIRQIEEDKKAENEKKARDDVQLKLAFQKFEQAYLNGSSILCHQSNNVRLYPNHGEVKIHLNYKIKKDFRLSNEVFEENNRRIAKSAARREKEEAEKDAETARCESGKQQQIADWVAEHGDANQKERFAANLFPREEAVEAMKNLAFAILDRQFARYERLTDLDVACECNYQNCKLKCETTVKEKVIASEWEQMKAVRRFMPNALEVSLREHYCECEDCETKTTRTGIYVKLQVGSFVFNREYTSN